MTHKLYLPDSMDACPPWWKKFVIAYQEKYAHIFDNTDKFRKKCRDDLLTEYNAIVVLKDPDNERVIDYLEFQSEEEALKFVLIWS